MNLTINNIFRAVIVVGIIACMHDPLPAQNSNQSGRTQAQSAAPQTQSTSESVVESATINLGEGQVPFVDRTPRYKLRPGDVLDLSFQFTPDFNQTLAVQPDGFISLREIGDIHVADKTVPDVKAAVSKSYSKILNRPEIKLELKQFEQPYFVASGEVNKPGKYDLRGEMTVTEAVAVAGGFTSIAKHSQVLLFRRTSEQWVDVKKLDVKKMMAKADLGEDLRMQPGDMLFVPQSTIKKLKDFLPKFVTSIRPY